MFVRFKQTGFQSGFFLMPWLTECVYFHVAVNSRQKEQHRKKSDVHMVWF